MKITASIVHVKVVQKAHRKRRSRLNNIGRDRSLNAQLDYLSSLLGDWGLELGFVYQICKSILTDLADASPCNTQRCFTPTITGWVLLQSQLPAFTSARQTNYGRPQDECVVRKNEESDDGEQYSSEHYHNHCIHSSTYVPNCRTASHQLPCRYDKLSRKVMEHVTYDLYDFNDYFTNRRRPPIPTRTSSMTSTKDRMDHTSTPASNNAII